MTCKKARTSYQVVVKLRVVDDFDLPQPDVEGARNPGYNIWTPVWRDMPNAKDPHNQEWANFSDKSAAEKYMEHIRERGWNGEYRIQEVISR